MKQERIYTIWINGAAVVVSNEVYTAYYCAKRREKYLEERDEEHGKMSYNSLDSDEFSGESIIVDRSESVEDYVIRKLMSEKLRKCLQSLSHDEKRIIYGIYFEDKSERQLAKEIGIHNMTLHSRKEKILDKIKKFIKN